MLHQEALSKFKRNAPHLQFSDLHKEIFNVDSWGAYTRWDKEAVYPVSSANVH